MDQAIRLCDIQLDRIGDDTHLRGRLPQAWRSPAGFATE